MKEESHLSAYLPVKYTLDFIFASLLLIATAPLMGLIALLIRLENRGPVVYHQTRVGAGEVPFQIYKFRTMVPNADQLGPLLTSRNDPRITPLGKWLRRTSLDELPQLFNILKGEMSFIGPRPEVPPIVATYTPEQRKVFAVRPGLSGWAQVNGRDELDIPTKLKLDLEYIENISLWLDLKILWMTPWAVISSRGVN